MPPSTIFGIHTRNVRQNQDSRKRHIFDLKEIYYTTIFNLKKYFSQIKIKAGAKNHVKKIPDLR